MKLAALGTVASCLHPCSSVDARDGSKRPATDAIAPEQIGVAAAISDSLEGLGRNARRTPGKKARWLGWPGLQPG